MWTESIALDSLVRFTHVRRQSASAYVHDDSDVTRHVCQTPAIKIPDENRSDRNDWVLSLDTSEKAIKK